MVADLRARAKLREFFLQWLKVEQVPDLAKDPKRFPGFDAAVASDLRTSLDLFLDDVVWGESSDFRQLLLADDALPERPAGEVLRRRPAGRRAVPEGDARPGRAGRRADAPVPAGDASPTRRPARRSTAACSSPRSVLGRSLRPPPEAVAPLAADLHPDLTTRERVALQTKPAVVPDVPRMINPLGFTLEHFDAVGRFRDEEKGKPIDATGGYQTRTGRGGHVRRRPRPGDVPGRQRGDARRRSSSSCSTTWSSSRSGPTGRGRWPTCGDRSPHNGFNIRKLMVEIVATSALTATQTRSHEAARAVADRHWPANAPIPDALRRTDVAHDTHPTRVPPRPGHRRGGPAVPPEPAQPGLRQPAARASSGWSSCSAPTASSRRPSGPTRRATKFTLKESLKPLEPFQDRTLILHGVCDKVRGDGDNHMRGIGCLLTGRRAVPRQHPGRLATPRPAGPAGISIDQEIKNYLQSDPATRTRFGSLEFGVMVPDRADTWTRMVYAGPNKPIAPIDDPYQMFAKLYGRMKDQESLKSVLDDLQDDLQARSARAVSAEDRQLLDEHATFVREMEQELKATGGQDVGHAVPELEPGVKEENDNMPKISKMQIDLMVNSFAADFARVATLQYTNSVGEARMRWLGDRRGPPRALAQAGQRREVAGEADQDQQVVLRAAGLPGEAAGRDARAGRRRQPARQHADRLDQRAGQGELAHARQHPVRAGRQRPRLQDGPVAQVPEACRTTGCCCRWPTAWATAIERFGNPDFCGDGAAAEPDLT